MTCFRPAQSDGASTFASLGIRLRSSYAIRHEAVEAHCLSPIVDRSTEGLAHLGSQQRRQRRCRDVAGAETIGCAKAVPKADQSLFAIASNIVAASVATDTDTTRS